jgi:hypothetical protein
VRSELLACSGIKVVRFWNNEVFTNMEGVLQRIHVELVERAGQKPPPPPPTPPPRGGGVRRTKHQTKGGGGVSKTPPGGGGGGGEVRGV